MKIIFFLFFLFVLILGKQDCYISDSNDPELLNRIIAYYNLYKNDNTKITDNFVKGLLSSITNRKNDIIECFLLDIDNVNEINPIIRFTNKENILKLSNHFDQSTLNKVLLGIDYAKINGFNNYCENKDLTTTDSMMMNGFIYMICGMFEDYDKEIKRRLELQHIEDKIKANLTKLEEYRNDTRFFIPSHQTYYKPTNLFHELYTEFKNTGNGHESIKNFHKTTQKFNELTIVNTVYPAAKFLFTDSRGHNLLYHHVGKEFNKRIESISERHNRLSRIFKRGWNDINPSKIWDELRHQYYSGDFGHRVKHVFKTMHKNWGAKQQFYYSNYYETKQHEKTIKNRYEIIGKFYRRNGKFNFGSGGGSEVDDESSGIYFTGLAPDESNIFNIFKLSNYVFVIQAFFNWISPFCVPDEVDCKYCFPKLPASENNCRWIEFQLLTSPFLWTIGFDPLDPKCEQYSNIIDWNIGFWYLITNNFLCWLIETYPKFSFLSFLLYEGGGVPLPANLSICLSICFIYGLQWLFWIGLTIIAIVVIIFILREMSVDDDMEMCKDLIQQLQENQIRLQRRLENDLTKVVKSIRKEIDSNKKCVDEKFDLYSSAIVDITLKLKNIESCLSI